MNISTSINVFFGHGPVYTQMKRVYDAGFRYMDINFADWVDEPSGTGWFPQSSAAWDNWVEEIQRFKEDYGVTLNQAHGPLFNILDRGERGDHLRAMCLPTLRAAAKLGIPWVVFHAGTEEGNFQDPAHVASLLAKNHHFFDSLVEEAEKLNVGIALENMSDKFSKAGGMYCARIEELIELCDSFQSKQVGICWDTGHANLQGVDQRASLNQLGSRLKCLHIQDSDGRTDQHTAPFYGNIDWNSVMRGLQDIHYAGDLTFEAHMIVRRVPENCQDAALALLYQIGCVLKQKFEGV